MELEESEGLVGAPESFRNYGETDWHRDWKLRFPLEYREKTFLNRELGYHHRADVYTNAGIAMEFQHSPITLQELRQREAFYPNLVWVLDGRKFKGFRLLKHLPDLAHPRMLAYDLALGSHLALIRRSDILAEVVNPKRLALGHPELYGLPITAQLFSFAWRQPHRVWFEAKAPLWIDLGGYFIYQLLHRQQLRETYSYVKMVAKKDFVEAMTNGALI